MVSYYNPLGMYQKGGGAACGHGGWYQPPLLEEGVGWGPPAPWQGGEWAPPPRAPSASASPAPRSSPGPRAPPPPPSRSPYEWMKKPSYQSQPNPGTTPDPEEMPLMIQLVLFPCKTRTKDKYRVVYTDHQRLELEKEFHYSRYITIRRKAELAANLGLSERQVKIWFQNRRAKERKQVKKREEVTNKDKLLDGHPSLQQLHQHSSALHHHQQTATMIHQSALAHQGLGHPGLAHQSMPHQGLSHQGMTHQGLHHQGLASHQTLHGVPPVQLI
ncbi:caudal type homeobox [Arctopsyche grandis]|uniref:caudal type homeobox n=1 Tax=Arctopsyche grandis TaxID=121162 RepID=UPI00406D9596